MDRTRPRINTGRQLEIDIAKALAIIFMVIVHTKEYYYNGESEIFEGIVEFLGSPPGAPIFMLALGVGIVYSRHNTAQRLFLRGVNLFVFSYVFNILVYAMPYFLEGDYATAQTEILDIDILQFAGLTFMFMGLVKKLKMTEKTLLPLVVLFQVANFLLQGNGIVSDNYFLAHIQGLFYWTCEDSYFPFFSWIIFPVIGFLFGQYLQRCDDKAAMYKKLGVISGVLYVILYVLGYFLQIDYGAYGAMYQESYYGMGLYGNLVMVAFCFFWLALCYWVSSILPQFFVEKVKDLSRNLTYIYILQYVFIICGQVFIIGEDVELNTVQTIALFIVYYVLCVVFSQRIRLFKTKSHEALHTKWDQATSELEG